MVTKTVTCYHCASTDLIRFGFQNGRQRYKCRGCGKTSRENKGSNAYDPARKAEILAAYHERGSLRAMKRIFGVWPNTVMAWLKKSPAVAALEEDAGKSQEVGRS